MTGSPIASICSITRLEMNNEYSGKMQACWKTHEFSLAVPCKHASTRYCCACRWMEGKWLMFFCLILRRGLFVGYSVYSCLGTLHWNSCLRRTGHRVRYSHCVSLES